MEFTPMNFVENLKYMGLGMLAIIIVMGAIILVTMALNSATKKKMTAKTKAWLTLGGVALLAALILTLVLTDGDCATCRKDGDLSLAGQKYCEEHYAKEAEAHPEYLIEG
jgi:branched-subunit amino acid transport protein